MEQKIKFPRSQKVYLPGKLYPNIRVAMRKVEQVPSVSFKGEEKIVTPNPEVYMYDTSGPFSDTEMSIDLKKGLPRMREEWIVGHILHLWGDNSLFGVCHLSNSLSFFCPIRQSGPPTLIIRKSNR